MLRPKKLDSLCRWILLVADGTECELKRVLESFWSFDRAQTRPICRMGDCWLTIEPWIPVPACWMGTEPNASSEPDSFGEPLLDYAGTEYGRNSGLIRMPSIIHHENVVKHASNWTVVLSWYLHQSEQEDMAMAYCIPSLLACS